MDPELMEQHEQQLRMKCVEVASRLPDAHGTDSAISAAEKLWAFVKGKS